MKQLSILFAAFLFQNIFPVSAAAQAQTTKGLLWKISGNGLTKPSYLYGTVHLICSSDFTLSHQLKKSVAQSEKLYLEIDMDDPAMNMKMLQLSMLKDKKLSDFFSEADYDKLNAFFRDSIGMPLAMLNMMKPFVLFSMITLKTMPCDKHESYEMSLVKMAKEQSKEVLGLETIEDQMKVFDDMPDSVQAQMVMRYVNEFDKQKADFQGMIEMYKAEDLDGLYNYIMSSPDIEGAQDVLLFNRNQKWIPVIEAAIKEEPTFFAVGAGHLAGEKGVIQLLKDKGYEITKVE